MPMLIGRVGKADPRLRRNQSGSKEGQMGMSAKDLAEERRDEAISCRKTPGCPKGNRHPGRCKGAVVGKVRSAPRERRESSGEPEVDRQEQAGQELGGGISGEVQCAAFCPKHAHKGGDFARCLSRPGHKDQHRHPGRVGGLNVDCVWDDHAWIESDDNSYQKPPRGVPVFIDREKEPPDWLFYVGGKPAASALPRTGASMTIEHLRNVPTELPAEMATSHLANGVRGFHESLFRSYQVLQKARHLLEIGTPAEVVLEIIDECYREDRV